MRLLGDIFKLYQSVLISPKDLAFQKLEAFPSINNQTSYPPAPQLHFLPKYDPIQETVLLSACSCSHSPFPRSPIPGPALTLVAPGVRQRDMSGHAHLRWCLPIARRRWCAPFTCKLLRPPQPPQQPSGPRNWSPTGCLPIRPLAHSSASGCSWLRIWVGCLRTSQRKRGRGWGIAHHWAREAVVVAHPCHPHPPGPPQTQMAAALVRQVAGNIVWLAGSWSSHAQWWRARGMRVGCLPHLPGPRGGRGSYPATKWLGTPLPHRPPPACCPVQQHH